MAKSEKQKLKLLYLMKILSEETDEDHGLTMAALIQALGSYEINAERKSIYDDIACLQEYGMDIAMVHENGEYQYRLLSHSFELAELKLLVDSIQSAKFITVKKSNALIHKLESLTSKRQAKQLQRQVFVAERVKTMNESIYYNVDAIHRGIGSNVQIEFQYFQWNVRKEQELRHDGAFYTVSPWALSWTDENYYMIAYDHNDRCVKHFRVDKMLKIRLTTCPREGKALFQQFDMGAYTKRLFGMYDGREEMVHIRFDNALAGVVLDRFGKEITLLPVNENQFDVHVKVACSRPFLYWVLSLGKGAKLMGPKSVMDDLKEELTRVQEQYM